MQPKTCEICGILTTGRELVRLEDGRRVTMIACRDFEACDAREVARDEAEKAEVAKLIAAFKRALYEDPTNPITMELVATLNRHQAEEAAKGAT
ncbi:MAG: hypothetical protein ACRDJ9_29510 [Dehalococcoidia bacterium]